MGNYDHREPLESNKECEEAKISYEDMYYNEKQRADQMEKELYVIGEKLSELQLTSFKLKEALKAIL